MATPPTHNLITLFTAEEYDDLYGFPHFSDEERSRFFTLSLHDSQLIASFKKLPDKVYCLLNPGYFRAKHSLIDFSSSHITKDRRYIMDTYFPRQHISRKLPHYKQQIRIQNKILKHEKYYKLNNHPDENIENTLARLIKRHPKARPLTKALLNYLGEHSIALPAYSTLQLLITKTLAQEQDRIFSICQKVIGEENQKLISQLLAQEDSLYPITTIKQDVKDFSYSELNDEIKRHDLLRPLFYMAASIIEHTDHPKKTVDYYGSLVNFYSVYKLNRMAERQACWYLLCYSFRRYQKINDN
jgi:hypothetical protein